ncbi:glycosyltransferase family 2 protein [Candidatus Pacearchaeota archaeon]|nr:glycosyltransferase family 2 protein [Candidatus Pacearchaeota archaeon]
MAGEGTSFKNAGYTFPKPLIDVYGKPMIQLVVENLNTEGNFIFLVKKEHYDKYSLHHLLNLISPGCKIVLVKNPTAGAAATALLAKEFINNKDSLLIANADQFIEWNSNEFFYAMAADECDGGVLTFNSTHPRWSYVRLGENGFISEAAEKKVISDIATVGLYYYKKGSDFIKYAEQMIQKNLSFNGDFYICPIFNEMIADGKKVRPFKVNKMWGLGTPEELNIFLTVNKSNNQ